MDDTRASISHELARIHENSEYSSPHWRLSKGPCVRPGMRYCFRSGRCRPNPRTKHISVPPRHMTKSYILDFNMISQHYRYKDTTSHTIVIHLPEYNTSAEGTCLSTDYNQVPNDKGKTHPAHVHTGPGSPSGTPS